MPKNPPTQGELRRIATHAIRMAVKTNAGEERCPYKADDPERRDHWLEIFRSWREEKRRSR